MREVLGALVGGGVCIPIRFASLMVLWVGGLFWLIWKCCEAAALNAVRMADLMERKARGSKTGESGRAEES